jgi:hypothetical protein
MSTESFSGCFYLIVKKNLVKEQVRMENPEIAIAVFVGKT